MKLDWRTEQQLLSSFFRTVAGEPADATYAPFNALADRVDASNEAELRYILSEFERQRPENYARWRREIPQVLRWAKEQKHKV